MPDPAAPGAGPAALPPDDFGTAQPDTSGVSTWRRAAAFERGIYTNLARWIARRPDTGAPGSLAAPYVGIVRATIWVWIGASILELAVVHLVIPWPWVRWPLLVVSIWGLIWMFGYLGGLIVHPHLVEPDRLRMRNGHTIEIDVPVAEVASITSTVMSSRHGDQSSRVVQLDPADDRHLLIAVSGQVNVHLTVVQERIAELPGGRYRFTSLSFWADDPASVAAAVRERMATGVWRDHPSGA